MDGTSAVVAAFGPLILILLSVTVVGVLALATMALLRNHDVKLEITLQPIAIRLIARKPK